MRLRRLSHETEYFTHLSGISASLRQSSLILAELSGIPVEERREAAGRLAAGSDEADAADDEFADRCHALPAPAQASALRSASMKRAFSSGRPIDTRSHSGMP